MRTRRLDPTATPEYRAATVVIVAGCGLAALGSVVPAVDHFANLAMLGLGVLAVLVVVARLLVRFVRERLEDAADAHTAAAWRATHQPAARRSATRQSLTGVA